MSALSPNSLIVITGITGWIASHAGLQALKAGYRVRGTVRDLGKAEALRAVYTKEGIDASPSRLEFVIIDDLLSESQFTAAFKGADGVAHIALPDFADDWVNKTVEAVIMALRAAAKEPGIKRFVLTSSCYAVVSPPDVPDKVMTDKDWNENALERYDNATEEELSGLAGYWVAYRAAKTRGEQAAWKFMETEKPGFELSTILADMNFGPILLGEPRTTSTWILNLFKGDVTSLYYPPQWYIDIRDNSRMHILALTLPELGNQRIWTAAAPMSWNYILATFRKAFPTAKLPEDVVGPTGGFSHWKIDSEVGRKALGGKWISLEQSVIDTAKSVGY